MKRAVVPPSALRPAMLCDRCGGWPAPLKREGQRICERCEKAGDGGKGQGNG